MPLPDPRRQTAARIQRTENYAKKIQRMFSQTVNDLLALPISKADVSNGNMFSFDAETDRVQRQVEQLLRRLQAAATLSIQKGVTLEWEEANKAADAILQSHFSKQVLASPYMKGWNARNHEAMQQFINRSDYGMNLSQRVWQSCRQLRDEMEVALTISIGEGEDAGTISRRVRQYLNDPDLMFRRFRYKDEKGRWQTKWKKRIKDPDNPGKYKFIDYDKDSYKDQWTGRGYYKSSAMNAMRVARTETNIAYRRADHARWQGLDFVLGQRVQLSKNHPCTDICDTLAGDYPKDFVFDGWHPQCFCFVTPILVDESEMAKMSEAFLRGEDYTPKREPITEYPQGFKDWVKENEPKIRAAQLRGTEPYFVRNNAEVVEGIINPNRKTENEKTLIDKFANLLRTNDWSTDNEQTYQLMEQWENMSIEQRIKALEKSELSGLVPDDFFDEESCFVDIYKPVSKDYIVDYADEVLRNIADGFDMSDVDAYVAFYNDGTILWTGEMDFDGVLDGKRKLPRTGLIAVMTNGGVLDNIYWAKNAKGMEAIKKYTGFKTVEKGVIIEDTKGASLKGSSKAETRRVLNNVIDEDYVGRVHDYAQDPAFRQYCKKLGINPDKVKPMNFLEADSGNSNKYRGNSDYDNNCVSCVFANEMRRRGLNITANIPNDILSEDFLDCWRTSKGKKPTYICKPTSFDLTDENATFSRIRKIMMDKGSRYIIGWDGIDAQLGHILCAENINGEIVFYDPQLGKNDCFWTLGEILARANPKKGLQILRVDNLYINHKAVNCLLMPFL